MGNDVIWIIIHDRPRREVPLRPLFDERFRLGVDLMYVNSNKEANALNVGDCIVDYFGGPPESDPWAQHIVQAGYVIERARHLHQEDLTEYPELFRLTIQMFVNFQIVPVLLERQGIIKYRRFRSPPSVVPLPWSNLQFRPGDNFKKLEPFDPEYHQLDTWWHAIVPQN